MMEYLIWFLGCATAGTCGVWFSRQFAIRRNWFDEPNHRSFHDRPIPRIGGAGMLFPLILALLIVWTVSGIELSLPWIVALIPAILIAVISFFDDRFELPRLLRFGVHVIFAAAVIWILKDTWIDQQLPLVGDFLPLAVSALLLVIWIVGLTNSYNFMDGIDGIAAIQGIVAILGWILLIATDVQLNLIPFDAILLTLIAVLGGICGFLILNWAPASIFMGDLGSTFMGFFLGAIPLAVVAKGVPLDRALEAGFLFVWPFVLDTGMTFTRRLIRREPIFDAHRSHVYQLLAGSFSTRDRGHRVTSLLYGVLAMLGVGLYWSSGPLWAKLAVIAGVWIAVVAWTYGIRLEKSPKPVTIAKTDSSASPSVVNDLMPFDIYLSPPETTDAEFRRVSEAISSGYIAPVGPQLNEFEDKLAQYLGIPEIHAVSSGTAAIHLGLRALGVGPGDCVLCPDLTFIASCNPIRYLGAQPVLVDVSRENWAIDPELAKEAIHSLKKAGRTVRAMIVVHALGIPAPMDSLMALAEQEGVLVLEDCAGAFGARYGSESVGKRGHAAAFSFNGNKILTTSGGGALYLKDEALRTPVRNWANQGKQPGVVGYDHQEMGYNYKLSNICAAIGLAQLETIGDRLERKRILFQSYQEKLADLPGFEFMPEPPYGDSNHWLCTVGFSSDAVASSLVHCLRNHRIEASPMWKPMHLQRLNQDLQCFGGEISRDIHEHFLSLPSGTSLSDQQLNRICDEIRRHLSVAS